jgi:hypothetical protein
MSALMGQFSDPRYVYEIGSLLSISSFLSSSSSLASILSEILGGYTT